MPSLSLRTRLILGILIPLLLVFVPFTLLENSYYKEEAISHVGNLLQLSTEKNAIQVDGNLAAAAEIATTLASFLTAEMPQSRKQLESILKECVKSHPEIIGCCIAFEPDMFELGLSRLAPYVYRISDSDSLLTSNLVETYDTDYRMWAWYENTLKTGEPGWCEPYFDDGGSQTLICTYSTPFFRNGKMAGMATVDISLEYLQKILSRISPHGVTYRLISSSGRFIAAPETGIVMKETMNSLAEQYKNKRIALLFEKMQATEKGMIRGFDLLYSHPIWLSYTCLPESRWFLMASIDESTILEPVYASLFRSFAFGLFVLFVTIGILFVASYRITAPLKKLVSFARELAQGNLDAKVGKIPETTLEISKLMHAFDKMVIDLKSNIEKRIAEETARKSVEGELRVARRIQASLLPRIFPPFPDRPEFDLFAMNEPSAFVAGDFYDYFFIDHDNLAIVIADVSGHGVPAAMFMAVTRTAIRNFSVSGYSPKQIVTRVNEVLSENNDDAMFVTLFYGHYNVKTGDLCYVNAGHNPPYIIRENGTLTSLPSTGPIAAVIPGAIYSEETISLEPEELLFTFTDGLTEAHSETNNDFYGEARLEALIVGASSEPVEPMCRTVYETINQFCLEERHDDMTLMVLKRH
ncbi:MAG: SpoIIE family protein phosphatase [Thermoguttaceae bacterium]